MNDDDPKYVAFVGDRLLAGGELPLVLRRTWEHVNGQANGDGRPVLIFEAVSGRQVDFELHGTLDEVIARVTPPPRTGPGRPKLGVVAREISLLPRHWEWLERQPNGASAALRRLVEEARHRDPERQRARWAAEATHRFMTAMAGDQPGYEEAMRALYAGDETRFTSQIAAWPNDLVMHLGRMAKDAFAPKAAGSQG